MVPKYAPGSFLYFNLSASFFAILSWTEFVTVEFLATFTPLVLKVLDNWPAAAPPRPPSVKAGLIKVLV